MSERIKLWNTPVLMATHVATVSGLSAYAAATYNGPCDNDASVSFNFPELL